VREERTNQGIAQETLAHMAGIERSHMGKIERGEHVGELRRHPFAEDGHANFGGDVTRFHVQLPPGGELVATDLEAVE